MNFDACFQLGYVIKPHGLKGELSVFLDTDQPFAYQELESVFVEQEQRLIPFFIDHIKIQGQKAVVAFDGINSLETANTLRAAKLWLPLEVLPPLNDNQFYYHEVIGFHLIDAKIGDIGVVKSVYDVGSQDLLAIEKDGNEILIPIVDSIIKKVDRKAKTIHADVPKGLVEIYTEGDEN